MRGRIYVACISTALSVFATTGWAFETERPRALELGLSNALPNQTFYNDFNSGLHDSSFNDDLIGSRRAAELRQRWDDLNREYETRSRHELSSREEYRAHVEQVRGFTRGIIGEVKGVIIQQNLRRVQSAAEKDDNLRAMKSPAIWAAAAFGVYTGHPVEFEISPATRASARADFKNRRGQLSVKAPQSSGSIDFASPIGRPNESESMTLAAGSLLPLFELSGSLSYSIDARLVSTELSRSLAPHLIAAFGVNRVLGGVRAEGVLRVGYTLGL